MEELVGFREDLAREARLREKRRGVRLNSRVRVALEWKDGNSQTVREEAYTRTVGAFGCLLVLRRELPLDQTIQVINLANEQANPGVVIWKGVESAEGWEFGIELLSPSDDFWGLGL
jgi:hypothetical protein